MNLFKKENVVLNSGKESDFKIDCDALTDEDIDCISYLISKKFKFSSVVGIPTGGTKLENSLKKYRIDDDTLPILICDDVLTTGGSMNRMRESFEYSGVKNNIIGVVIFSRGVCPEWIYSVFKFNI